MTANRISVRSAQLVVTAFAVFYLSACSLVTRRESSAEVVSEPSVENLTPDVTEKPPTNAGGVRQSVIDQDLKKKQDDGELKKRVVVLPFLERKNTLKNEILVEARHAFVNGLNEQEEMIALDPSVLKIDLGQHIKNNAYDLKAIAGLTQAAGVSSLLEGRVLDVRFKNEDSTAVDNASSQKFRQVVFEVVVQVRLLNIRSGQELFNTVKTVTVEDAEAQVPENILSETFFNRNPQLTQILLRDAFIDFTPKLTESLKLITWEGRIAALQGDRIFLNVGQISGVKVGDILKVVEDANEIYDTEMGYHIGKVPGKVKGTLEIVGFFGQDGAVSVIHSGAGFKENDRVEVYQ